MKTRISLFCLMVLTALVMTSCRPDVEACFSSTANAGVITFNSDCSIEATSYAWNFGDGESSVLPNPTHTYAASGTYEVTLVTTDKKGKTSTSSKSLTVTVDPCIGMNCNNGTCVNGTCQCNAGYEGANCATAMNQKFLGNFALTESCSISGTAGPYSVTASAGSTAGAVGFVGLWQIPTNVVTATIASDGVSFTIARQLITSSFEIQSSNGTINAAGTEINLTYEVYNTGGNLVDVCTAVLVK